MTLFSFENKNYTKLLNEDRAEQTNKKKIEKQIMFMRPTFGGFYFE